MTRNEKIQAHLAPHEAVLVTSDAARRYLTGMASSAGYVLLTADKAWLLVDFRYIEKARQVVQSLEVVLAERVTAQISELLQAADVQTLYVEAEQMSVATLAAWRKALPEIYISDEARADGWLWSARQIKDAGELAAMRAAQQLTDDTFAYILPQIAAGRTEREIMLDMEFYMRRAGSEGVAFDFIVVSGRNSSLPHGVPTDKKVAVGDFVTMDFGAVVNGYRSDMTRTVAVGRVDDAQRAVYQTVLDAQTAVLAQIRAGENCRDIDKIARDIINGAGYEGCFGHGLGHSVGLEIHESPACNLRDETKLLPGMIMTVEPGIYIEGKFGVRIEDMVCITESGCDNMTHSPKELIIV